MTVQTVQDTPQPLHPLLFRHEMLTYLTFKA
jgi:hypothetical protein